MKYTKFAATALFAAAATGIAAGTGYAAPVEAPTAPQPVAAQVHGQDQGVDYTIALAEAGDAIVTSVTGGRFSVDADGQAVSLTNESGAVVAQVPLTGKAGGEDVRIVAAVADNGQELSLTPEVGPHAHARAISAQQWFFAELQRAALGAAVGAVIGGAIGLLGLVVSAIPGAIIGALIGLLVAGGQPLIDSGSAYFSGQP
ncbi:hypothetical protein [Nocardia otitidiscaviarum]|uniref:hypothetical protein n=1 Tax=Nocardia otitidiscaviarum TaxID=1823 RepID=UPI001E2864C8|nr:hypothetical protein [Nocardia otitidiscaviarum]